MAELHEYMPVMTDVNAYFDARVNVGETEWGNLIGDINLQLFSPIENTDGVEFVGSETSYGKFSKPYVSGSSRTWYFIFKTITNSSVFSDWKTLIGNEASEYKCSTIAMDSNGYIKFTRPDIIPSTSLGFKCSDWHVVAWVSNGSQKTTKLWIDGDFMGTVSSMQGWADDTYLCRGSGWFYEENNTVFRAIAIADSAHSDSDVVYNSRWLYDYYVTNYVNDLNNPDKFAIKTSTLKSFADEARRIDGSTDSYTTDQMINSFKLAKIPKLQDKTIRENGRYSVDINSDYDGFSNVTVMVTGGSGVGVSANSEIIIPTSENTSLQVATNLLINAVLTIEEV